MATQVSLPALMALRRKVIGIVRTIHRLCLGLPSSKDEPFFERIFGVKVEFISANDRGRPSNLRNNSVVRTKLGCFCCLHSHRAAEDTFDRDLLIQTQLAPG